MITKDTTVVNDTDVDRGIPNTSWGLIKDHTLQLRDGYLNRTPSSNSFCCRYVSRCGEWRRA